MEASPDFLELLASPVVLESIPMGYNVLAVVGLLVPR
jgi:hypothetical protein